MDNTFLLHMVSRLPDQEPLTRQMEAKYRIMQRDALQNHDTGSWLRGKSFYAARLMYEQVLDEEGREKVPEIMTARLDPEGSVQQITMKRPGGGFRLEFEKGKIYATEYPTPAGELDVAVRTTELAGRFTETKFWARIRYEIWLGEEKQGETLLEILGTPRGSREENFR